jgi:predicted nucleotidyltransferase
VVSLSEGFIQQMVKAVVQEVKPQCIYLFGSRARGTATEDSDVDLLIVETEAFDQNRNRWSELKRIRRVLKPFHVPKDVLVCSHDEFEKWRGSINHIIAHAAREGRLVYERS